MTTLAEVRLWGRTIGAVALQGGGSYADFQYDSAFARSGIQVSPLVMPLSERVFRFPGISRETFHGLPGLLSDSLPDRFGNALINAWLATQGRHPGDFNSVERLCYTGSRGMGALEFHPGAGPDPKRSTVVQVDALVALASKVLRSRGEVDLSFDDQEAESSLADILRVGTSAGGARAKAVIAWNRSTNEVRSGQVVQDSGFEHWLLKFDGVSANRDKELADPTGYGAVELAYSEMAIAAGIEMCECRLFEEGGRRHFMTRRFDRDDEGRKIHMQSLGALAHYDFNVAGAHSYEQVLQIIQQLGLPKASVEEQFKRMAFNIVARNQDDHVKNIAFLMDRSGQWSLAPAFDVTYAYNPSGAWTGRHQMTLNGKQSRFSLDDFRTCARRVSMKRGRAEQIVEEVFAVVRRWPEYADAAKVGPQWRDSIFKTLRLELGR